MLVPTGEVIALGTANSSPPYFMRKLMKRKEPGTSQLCGREGRESRCNLKQETFRLNVRKSFFMIETVKWGNRLSKEVMCPFLEIFKAQLHEVFSSLIWSQS